MASHDLAHQPQERLITEIADLKRQISEMRTLQKQGAAAINLNSTGINDRVASAVPDGVAAVFVFTLTNSDALTDLVGRMIFATFQFTLYQGSISSANAIGHIDTPSLGFQYKWAHWSDWQAMSDTFLTNGYRAREYVWIENHTGSTQDIWMRGEWRYIINGGTVSVS